MFHQEVPDLRYLSKSTAALGDTGTDAGTRRHHAGRVAPNPRYHAVRLLPFYYHKSSLRATLWQKYNFLYNEVSSISKFGLE